jgi:hypothetical protein
MNETWVPILKLFTVNAQTGNPGPGILHVLSGPYPTRLGSIVNILMFSELCVSESASVSCPLDNEPLKARVGKAARVKPERTAGMRTLTLSR